MPNRSPSARILRADDSAPSAALAPDRSIGTWPAPEKNFFWNQPLMPGRGEVLGLGHERHPPRERQRHEQPVGVREVVAGEDRGSLGGDVLGSLDDRAEDDPEQRADRDPLQEPVEHPDLPALLPTTSDAGSLDPSRPVPQTRAARLDRRSGDDRVKASCRHDERLPRRSAVDRGPPRADGRPPDRRGAQPRVHRVAVLDEAVGPAPRRARVRRRGSAAARATAPPGRR